MKQQSEQLEKNKNDELDDLIPEIKKYLPNITFTEVNEKLENTGDLPTIPSIVERIYSLASDSEASVNELANVISNDVSMTSTIFRVANSAFYAPRSEITTLKGAVMMIGFMEVKHICAATKLISSFTEFGNELSTSIKDFWKHSLACAMISKIIAQKIGYKNIEELYFAGLLHDFGKIIIFNCFPKHFQIIALLGINKNFCFHEMENRILGVDHTYCGSIVASRWKLPETIKNVIANHHNIPPKIENIEEISVVECSIIHLSDYLAHKIYNSPFIPPLSNNIFLNT